MFKISKLLSLMLNLGIMRMTADDPLQGGGGGSGGLPLNTGGQGGQEGGDGGGLGLGDGGGGGTVNPWDSVPRSWAADIHSHWDKVSPEVRQIVHKRETDYEKGIRQYADGHTRWSKVAGRFQNMPQGFDTEAVLGSLADNHLALEGARTNPAQLKKHFSALAEYYGLDPKEMFAVAAQGNQNQGGGTNEAGFTPGQMAQLEKMFAPVASRFQQMDRSSAEQNQQATAKKVDAFFSDPKNKYVKEAGPALIEILKSGESTSLEAAYEMAVLRSPELRVKYLSDLAQPAGEGQGGEEPPTGVRNLKSSGPGNNQGKPKTVDDTMNSVLRRHGMLKT
jgi:hypothetical protein